MSDDTSESRRVGRRDFLSAIAGVSVGSVAVGAARPAFAEEVGDERTKVRYQETDHVLAFYRTNRYYKKD